MIITGYDGSIKVSLVSQARCPFVVKPTMSKYWQKSISHSYHNLNLLKVL